MRGRYPLRALRPQTARAKTGAVRTRLVQPSGHLRIPPAICRAPSFAPSWSSGCFCSGSGRSYRSAP